MYMHVLASVKLLPGTGTGTTNPYLSSENGVGCLRFVVSCMHTPVICHLSSVIRFISDSCSHRPRLGLVMGK